MTTKEYLLASFDDAWSHDWESYESKFADLSEEEAYYQSPVYAADEKDETMPPSGTILWHLVHLGQCWDHYGQAIAQRPKSVPEPEPPQVTSLADALKQVKAIRARFRTVIEGISEERLSEKMANGRAVIDFCRAAIRHETWHIGQMAVARRLYKASR